MTKITFIGAGSLGFTTGLVRDILTFPLLEDATISLMDIHAGRLEQVHKAVSQLIEANDSPAKVESTLDRMISKSPRNMVSTSTSAIRAALRVFSASYEPCRR